MFVAGTGTDIGKTYVTAALLRALIAEGRTARALKPVVSGFDEAAPAGSDPAILLEAMGQAATRAALDRIAPWRYRAPLAPDQAARLEGRRIDGQAVIAFCETEIAAQGQGLLFIESAGGIMSPLDEERSMLDLAKALAAPVLLIVGSYLGTISHTLTAARVIEGAGLDLSAVIINESVGGLPLDESLRALNMRLPGVVVAAVPRDGDGASLLARLDL